MVAIYICSKNEPVIESNQEQLTEVLYLKLGQAIRVVSIWQSQNETLLKSFSRIAFPTFKYIFLRCFKYLHFLILFIHIPYTTLSNFN